MSTSVIEVDQLGTASCPEISEGEKQVISNDEPVVSPEVSNEQAKQSRALQLQERVQRSEILQGRDALEYLRLLRSSPLPEPAEKQIVQSLEQELARLIPKDAHLTRRGRKLAWQFAKCRHLDWDWDYIFLSELTPAEKTMSDADFAALFPDDPKPTARRGGRPRKYSTPAEEKKGHAERQRRYRAKRQDTVEDATKTPLQLM